MMIMLIVLVGLGLAGAMATTTMRSWREERVTVRVEQRLGRSLGRPAAGRVRRGPSDRNTPRALVVYEAADDARIARWLPRADALRVMLNKTGRQISLLRYVSWMAGTAVAVLAAVSAMTGGNYLVALLLAISVGIIGPRLFVERMVKRRLASFTQQFPDAIDLIIRALRAGLPLGEALISIGDECADPIGAEFRRVAGAMAIGRSIEQALWDVERNIDSPELRFFIISIVTQMQTGGNLGETLGSLAEVLRQRAHMRMKVKAMTGEARASAMVLGSLPFVIALLMFFTNPEYITPLFTDPRGLVLLAGGGVMLMLGVGIMAKLVSFEI